MTKICLKTELAVVEIGLESEDYEWVLRKLEELNNLDGICKEPEYFLMEYFWGQAIFRKEMSRKRVREKNVDLAIEHLTKSLRVNSNYIDTHILLGMALMVKAKFEETKIGYLETARKHFEICINIGNSLQVEFCKERIAFIDNEMNKQA